MPPTVTDRIEKTIALGASRSRVWRALSDSAEFGAWFGARFTASFTSGAALMGELTDPGNEGRAMALRVVALEPESYFAYRWRPHDLARPVDDDDETTLVEFFLSDTSEGTLLRVVESGFERVPAPVRSENYRANFEGWGEQAGRLAAYVDVPVSDRVERSIELRAPLSRVWRAVARPQEFGKWFGLEFEGGEFVPGEPMRATITDPPEYAGTPFSITIVEVSPETRFSFRWHPYPPEPGEDASAQPTTLVEFTLQERGERTFLTVAESGFDAIPEKHRIAAFRSNDEGWSIQVQNIRRHLDA